MLNTFKGAPQSFSPLAATVLLNTVVLSACAFRYGIYMMLPDNFNYITYWQQLFEGSFTYWQQLLERSVHATGAQTPKPLLVLMFGILWKLTGGPAFLIVLFIGVGTLAIYGSARIVNRICSPASSWSVLALLLPSAVFLRSVLSGYSELISAAGTVWLIARHLERDRIRPPDRWTAMALFSLNLIRPENWLLSAGVAIAAGLAVAASPSRTCGPGKALWEAKRSLLTVSIPLLAPLVWLGFDYLAFGDPLFSFKVTTPHFAKVTTANSQAHWWAYVHEVVNSIRDQVSIFALGCAGIGIAVVGKSRRSLLILLGLPVITTMVFYFAAYFTGIELYDRFFFVPVLVILIASCIGLAWTTKWLLRLKVRPTPMPVDYFPLAVGKRVLVIAAVILVLVVEHRRLPFKISEFDTFARWRTSALTAAEAVRRDIDYGPSIPVIVRVEDLALVGWALASDGRNLTDTLLYKREGRRLLSDVLIVYFIINQPHQGESFPELASGHSLGFRTHVIYDDATTVVYKLSRIS